MENYCLINNLSCKLDWLRVTLHDESLTSEYVMEILGYNPADFVAAKCGANGYRTQHRNSLGVSVLSDGKEDMGIHVSIPGSAISDCLEHFASDCEVKSWDIVLIEFLNTLLEYGGRFTRLDLAVDDIGGNYYSVDELEGLLRSGKSVISKWRSWRPVADYDFDGKLVTGKTVYFGKGCSDLLLRVYDKQAEQNSKLPEDSPERIGDAWIRWELEAKKDYAQRIVESLVGGEMVGSVAVGILKQYITIHLPGDGRKDRLPVDPKWQKFCDGVDKLSLYVAPPETSIEQKRSFLINNGGRSFAMVVAADGGSFAIVDDMLKCGSARLSQADLEQIEDHKNKCAAQKLRKSRILYPEEEFIPVPEDEPLFGDI